MKLTRTGVTTARPLCHPSWLVACLLAWFVIPQPALAATESDSLVRLMNVGKAYLENRDSVKAIETYQAAVQITQQSAPAWRNLARAYLLARKEELALEALSRASQIEAESTGTSYLSGLACVHLSRFKEAIPHFETAARLDPTQAPLRYQLANAYQANRQHDQAKQQFHETIRLDPLHASAHYKLASYARLARNMADFQRLIREFARLRTLLGESSRSAEMLERCSYTQAEPAYIPAGQGAVAFVKSAIEVTFTEDTAFPAGAAAHVSAVYDIDQQGRCTLFTAANNGGTSLLQLLPTGKFQRTNAGVELAAVEAWSCCIVGNFHDDVPANAKYDPNIHAYNDLFLCGPEGVRLLKGAGTGTFKDVTQAAGLSGLTGRRGQWIDYDHDGDLDLLIARSSGLELWQNNGDGRFQNVTAEVGIKETGPSFDVATADWDANGATDLVVACGTQPTLVFQNQRAGRFAPLPEPPGPWPAARRVLANDLDNDGYPDTVLISDAAAMILFGQSTRRQALDLGDFAPSAAALIDFDNDGWLDICVVGHGPQAADNGSVRLWRNVGRGGWQEVTTACGLSAVSVPGLSDVLAADIDADSDTDLVLVTATGHLRLLRNQGGHINGQLKLRLVGTKTNPAGLGTHIELRDGSFWVTRSVTALPIEIGLGGRTHLDALQTLWTNGVVDNQINLARPTQTLKIVEKNVATGSCPFLYAWDGRRFRFVTDLLGNSPLGLSLRRDVLLPADPDEFVMIGEASGFPPRDGFYTVEVTEEFREVLYLDQARLVAVDHPPDVEVHPTDKLMPPPFPASELWLLGAVKKLVRVDTSDGLDRTGALQHVDGQFAPPGTRLPPPLRGMCRPLALTLDFGSLDPSRPLVLALTGWLQYGDASTNIALSQNSSLTIIPPTLAAETAPGVWVPLDVTVGMPAGKTKTVLCDLAGNLPAGTRRLRLTTTFEICWDRIALLERRPRDDIRLHALSSTAADLHWRGFSELKTRAAYHPTTPDYDMVADRPPWRTTLQGWCTRYGDVLELVTENDQKLALLNAGDALTLKFPAASLPPVPAGQKRTFFFYSIGWDKDADYNVAEGDTVEPLPVAHVADENSPTDWYLRYNTRWVPRNRFASTR